MMLTPKESWTRIDSSKMSDFMQCPRYFFFRHILGWEYEGNNINLIFGEAWHRAKEYLLQHDMSDATLAGAMDRFYDYYRQYYTEVDDLSNCPKSPGDARDSLLKYRDMYKGHMGFKLIDVEGRPATELYGTAPLGNDRKVHFRIDAIGETDSGKIVFIDHKTSGSDNPAYQAVYRLSNQMQTYYHVINCLFGPENVYGGIVDLSIFRKKGHDHKRIVIRKSIDLMSEWLWNANAWIEQIESEIAFLQSCTADDPYMKAFPKNEKGCTAYNRKCKYYDFCTSMANPLRHTSYIPDRFRIDFWDPADREKEDNIIEVGG